MSTSLARLEFDLSPRWTAGATPRSAFDTLQTALLQNYSPAGFASRTTSWHSQRPKKILADAISRLSDLPDRWDGEGAQAIAPDAIIMASGLIAALPDAIPTPDFSPNPNGTISFYWTLSHGYAELEIGRTRHSWALLDQTGKAIQTCSGSNRAFDHNPPLMDLIRALSPRQEMPTYFPIAHLVMANRWTEEDRLCL